MKLTKNEWIAGAWTAGVMALVIACLLLFGYTSVIPETEEGLSVSFGDFIVSSGTSQSIPESTTAEPTEPEPSQQDPFMTQDDESVFLDAEAKKKKEEEARRQEEERKRKEQEAKAAAIQSQVANVFGASRNQEQANNGNGDTPAGHQGQKDGTPGSSNITGGGEGFGSFSLNGRSLSGGLPRPSYNISEEGTVVVRIVVNAQGKVMSSDIELGGTTTSNTQLRQAALDAAKQAQFNAINGSQNQSGTITYHFKLK